MHGLVRAGLALVFAVAVSAKLVPATVAGAEPSVPANAAKVATLFAAHGPDGSAGYWVWDPSGSTLGGQPGWHFQPIAVWTTLTNQPERPAWPEDVTTVQAIEVTDEGGRTEGYWVWNPYRFVGGGSGPTFWSPTWDYFEGSALE